MSLPNKDLVNITTVMGRHRYNTPDGSYWGVTTFLNEDGSKTNGLVRWAANVEREHVIKAVHKALANAETHNPQQFEALIRQHVGDAKRHEAELDIAAQYGVEAHQAVQRLSNGEEPGLLSIPAALSVDHWKRWFDSSSFKVVSTEHPVWSKKHGFGGTIDLIAESSDGLGIVDYKTRPEVYLTDHCQLAAYFFALKEFLKVNWAYVVGIPRQNGEKLKVVELGNVSRKKKLSPEQLFERFLCIKRAWEISHE